MKFEEITAEEFRDFVTKSPYKSFMQTPEIASLREKSGWKPNYLAVKKDDEILAATLIVSKPTFFKKLYFYAPGGPVIDLEDTKLTNFFFNHLKEYIKKYNGYILHIDPYYELIERDRDGLVVEGGFNHQKALKNLENLGFKEMKNASQPKYLFVTPIENRTETELMESFKRNTRNHIRKAEKMGVTVRELKREELKELKKITESTSKRRDFTDKPLSYYENMYDLFHGRGEVKFMVAEADVPEQGKTVLSAAMFMTYGDEVVYLFSGSDEKYMRDYNAQYLIQWHMINYAAKNNFKIYNFYGINGLPDPNSKDYGIYDFKKGFGGHVVELIGSYELILSPLYSVYKKLRH